jgi:ribonuclease HI
MNQKMKKVIAENLKKLLKGTGVKFTLSVNNHSTICMTIKSAPVDLIDNMNKTLSKDLRYQNVEQLAKDYTEVNQYWYKEHFTGKALDIIDKCVNALYSANYYDHSDPMSDYFNVAYYISLRIGKYNKPFEVIA